MAESLILFLPSDPQSPIGWTRVKDGVIAGAGERFEGEANGEDVIAFAPAAQIGLDWINLPDLPQAQRDSAARELIAERVIGGALRLHVVTGIADDGEGRRPVVWTEEGLVEAWLSRLSSLGISPRALVPVQFAVPAPLEGFVEGAVGAERIVRGPGLAFVSDPALKLALLGEVAPTQLSERQSQAVLFRVAESPPLNLIAGRFAPRRSWALGAQTGRRIALLVASLVGLTLLIPPVQNWQMNRAAARLEAETATSAAQLFPSSSDPAGQLKAAISARRGGGAGFLPTLSVVSNAVSSTANVELTGLRFTADGTLETTVRATNAAEAAAVRRKIEAAGFSVETGAETTNQGRLLQAIKVRGS